MPTMSPEQTPYSTPSLEERAPSPLVSGIVLILMRMSSGLYAVVFVSPVDAVSGRVMLLGLWLPLSTVVNVGQATSRIPVELGRLTSRDRPRPQTSSGYWRGLRAGSLWTVPT